MPLKSFENILDKRLKNSRFAAGYLKASLEETFKDGDYLALSNALNDVIRAQGKLTKFAKNAAISRQHLHRLLAGKTSNPSLKTLVGVLKVLNLKLKIVSEGR